MYRYNVALHKMQFSCNLDATQMTLRFNLDTTWMQFRSTDYELYEKIKSQTNRLTNQKLDEEI